eukprot:24657_1
MTNLNNLVVCGLALFLSIATPYVCPSIPIIPLVPISLAFGFRIGGARFIDGIIAAIVTGTYFTLLHYPISIIVYFIPYHWCVLSTYSIFPVIFYRTSFGMDNEGMSNRMWFRVYMLLFWDGPLLSAFQIVSHLGGQLSAPLITIIDHNLCVGALPCAKQNVLQLYEHPYNVRAVINLCNETCGPTKEYEKYNMKYIQLNTVDTTPPSTESVALGMQFIRNFIKWKNAENNGSGRVFVHCKGGRGRSVATVVCWLLSQGFTANEAMDMIKSKREIASRRVLHYKCVQHFLTKYA